MMNMIAYLKGQVMRGGEGWQILLVGGVGYRVFPVGCDLAVGETAEVQVVDFLREDRHDLYVFAEGAVKDLFESLITVSGIGPKLAQKMLGMGNVDQLTAAIIKGDVGFLTTIPGVGKKTAQKIVLELKGILVDADTDSVEDADTLEALVSLGYARKDVVEIVRVLRGETQEEKLREALQLLSR